MGEIATLTHARLRAAQGDVAGARRIVAEILAQEPEHAGALALLASLVAVKDAGPRAEPEPALAPPEAAEAGRLAATFRARLAGGPRAAQPDPRVVRLEDWLARIRPAR